MPESKPLILKRLDWGDGTPPNDEDWAVWYGEKRVGRIFHSPVGNPGEPWMWTITVVMPGFTLTNGYGHSVDRDAAMKAFRRRWDDASMSDRLRRAGDRAH